jgi:hypothetical protein
MLLADIFRKEKFSARLVRITRQVIATTCRVVGIGQNLICKYLPEIG